MLIESLVALGELVHVPRTATTRTELYVCGKKDVAGRHFVVPAPTSAVAVADPLTWIRYAVGT